MIAHNDRSTAGQIAFKNRSAQWFAWNTEILANAPESRLFDPDYWFERQAVRASAPGRAAAYFLEQPGQRGWVLRRYRRGGLLAHLNDRHYLFTGARRSRPVRELTLLDALYRDGQPVPRPVAAMGRRVRAFYSGALITEIIPDSETWASRLTREALSPARWETLGRVIAGLHERGLCHADLNARNVLVDTADRIFVIDFDKARFRASGRWQAANLSRLRRSLDKFAASTPVFHFTEDDWRALRLGYERAFAAGL